MIRNGKLKIRVALLCITSDLSALENCVALLAMLHPSDVQNVCRGFQV